jgi:hypothetical protein
MRMPRLVCPCCKTKLSNREFGTDKPFICPECLAELRLAPWYVAVISITALVLDIAACVFLGLRGITLVVVVILAWFPIDVVWNYVIALIFPSVFERIPVEKSHVTTLDLK